MENCAYLRKNPGYAPMIAMCAQSHLCKHCVSTLPQILCVNFAAKITNGVQLLFEVKATFVRLKFLCV